jgi:hypothetical protein
LVRIGASRLSAQTSARMRDYITTFVFSSS